MRAAINLLQAATSASKKVTDEIVYSISGRASPDLIKTILQTAHEGNYLDALDETKALIYNQGISPTDLIRQIHRELKHLNLDTNRQVVMIERIAEAEFRLGEGADGEIQIAAVLAHLSSGSGPE
jgi:replication factor C small subunit